jgi:hypothetical protein
MTVTPVLDESPGLNSPTGRFSTWLVLGDSDLARDVRARAWNLVRSNWRDRDPTLADKRVLRQWLDQELDDIFTLAAKGVNPELRTEALRVRVGVGRPKDVDTDAIARLLSLLYVATNQETLLERWADDQ